MRRRGDDRFLHWAQGAGLSLEEEHLQQLAEFEKALYAANRITNMTRVPRGESEVRHFIDSLLFHDLIPSGSRVLDIGTGPGLPAWPLACARPDLMVTALDSNGKMIAFLESQPLPNLRVVQERAEDFQEREEFDVVTGRALAPLPIQLELSAAFAVLGGWVIPMRTPQDDFSAPDWERLGLRPAGLHKRVLPYTDVARIFPVYAKEKATPKKFPRRWAEIKAHPLIKITTRD